MNKLPRDLKRLLNSKRQGGFLARPDDPKGIAMNIVSVRREKEALKVAVYLLGNQTPSWIDDLVKYPPEVKEVLMSMLFSVRKEVASEIRRLIFIRRMRNELRGYRKE